MTGLDKKSVRKAETAADDALTVREAIRIARIVARESWNPDEDGLLFGLAAAQVNKIQVCWMSDTHAIENAARIGANLIITHESPFFPYNVTHRGGVPDYLSWHTNHNRIKLLAAGDIAVVRMHGPLDSLCIFDAFADALGLGAPAVDEPGYVKIYDIPPIAYKDLIEHVKKALEMPALRASNGCADRVIKRVGLPWGGLGLFVNVGYMQKLLNYNCDVFIAGETDNYGIRFAADAGVDMIETGHEISENIGIRRFSEILGDKLSEISDIQVIFYENTSPFNFC
jgi:putative NIF3 family GTP cyclohydrolase 1 type 2